ncbi:type VI secretion system secreted protein VgrG [Arboricoccus pini]|uniref:Type VI secretion system secreted protein VgrG n=1 Tax=Arboricoccus pini TaxID=1963835 RepID=A0A212RQ57_9PROT|nr:type VI secretion system tip protein TssI/VgrG [Arboricoccus pini]SNB74695.1 type VI secretion system secreted protein VgrG [Arboricoccus pini]
MSKAAPAFAAPSLVTLLDNDRYAAITSAAFDVREVRLISVKGTERLSEPFIYDVRFSSLRRMRSFAQAPGQRLTVGFKLKDHGTRYIDGFIQSLDYLGIDETRSPIYEARIVPWLSFLAQRQNSRCFQNMTSIQIVQTIFADHAAIANFTDRTGGAWLPTRPFCVQYHESDLNFISRLLEQDGIYYFFTHAERQHRLELVNRPSSHRPCDDSPIQTKLNLRPYRVQNDVIWDWREHASLQPGRVVLQSYDHEKPNTNLMAFTDVPEVKTGGVPIIDEVQAAARRGAGPSPVEHIQTDGGPFAKQREIFSFPGCYQERRAGEFHARVLAEEIACRRWRAHLKGSPRHLTTGSTFKAANPFEITDTDLAPREIDNYLAVAVTMSLTGDPEHGAHGDAGSSFFYEASIEAQLAVTQFRPPRVAMAPVINGPQTAVVVGRKGDIVTTDQFARIKVQFHWDRYGTNDEASSTWIRVAQDWAGKNYGGFVIPRIGQEVVVAFINGNPDWPLVTGCVYNAVNMPPEAVPDNAMRSTFKTRTENGRPDEFNELTFEDRKGREEVFMRAQRDYRLAVGDTHTIEVARRFALNMPMMPTPLPESAGALPPRPGGPGSRIEVTPEKISFVVNGPTGPQAIEITPTGIVLVGMTIGMMARGAITALPPPLPTQSPLATKTMAELAAAEAGLDPGGLV